nr:transmembrane protein 252 isoform X2 [Columba livia]
MQLCQLPRAGASLVPSQQTIPYVLLWDMCSYSSLAKRPDFYPPSYEDSTDPEKQSSVLPVDSTIKQEEIINMPPPPYSESSAELISETDEQEQPPPYELSVQWLQQQQTADQRSNLRRTESNFNPSTQENSYQQDTDCQGISERATPVRTSETGSG